MKIRTKDITTIRILIFLFIIFGILYIPWIIGMLIPALGAKVYAVISFPAVFMGAPALSVFITRKLTQDTTPLNFSTKIFKNKKALLFSALLPGAAIFMGTVLFFLIFPEDLDFQGRYISATYGAFGAPQDIELTIGSMFLMGFIVYAISAIAFPIWYIALGEDIGWQGYMLPMLCRRLPVQRAVIINGALWGLAHAPLIYYGMNYGTDYFGAPYTGIIMMVCVTIVLGTYCSLSCPITLPADLRPADSFHSRAQMHLCHHNALAVCPPFGILSDIQSKCRHMPLPSCANLADRISPWRHICQYPLHCQHPKALHGSLPNS